MENKIVYLVDYDCEEKMYLIYKNGALIYKIFSIEYNVETINSICTLIEGLTENTCIEFTSIFRE
jgi:hypothetical protein